MGKTPVVHMLAGRILQAFSHEVTSRFKVMTEVIILIMENHNMPVMVGNNELWFIADRRRFIAMELIYKSDYFSYSVSRYS